jgi:hypothetical protein
MDASQTPGATADPAAAAAPGQTQEGAPPAEGTPAAPQAPSVASKLIEAQKTAREATARATAAEQEAAEYREVKALFAKDPDKALAKLGSSYEKLTNHYAGPEEPWKDEIAELKGKLTEREKAEQTQKAEAARKAHVEHVAVIAKEGGDKYKLVTRAGTEAFDTAIDAVANAWEADGKPNIDEAGYNAYLHAALAALEAHYAAQLKKFADPPAAGEQTEAARPPATSTTITQSHAGAPGARPAPNHRKLPRDIAAEWAAEQAN